MEITRETSLKQALDTAITLLEQLRDGTISIGGRALKADDTVTLEVEIESSASALDFEIELKWQAPGALVAIPAAQRGEGASETAANNQPARRKANGAT